MLGGVLVLATIFWRSYRKVRDRRESQAGGSNTSVSTDEQRAEELKEEFESVLYELREFVSESMAKLDTKVRYLNKMIMEAEEKIERLEELTDETSRDSPEEEQTGGGNSATDEQPDEAGQEQTPSPEPEMGGNGRSQPEAENQVDRPSPADRERAQNNDETLQNKPMYRWVRELAGRGLDREEVAERTGLDEAEVDVILSLQDIQSDRE